VIPTDSARYRDPMYLTKTFIVHAPIDRVYTYLSDPRNSVRPRADGTVVTVERIPDPDAPLRERYRMDFALSNGELVSSESVYLELDPPRHITCLVVAQIPGHVDLGPMRVIYDLSPVVGGTHVRERGETHPGLVKAAFLVFARMSGIWRRQSLPAGAGMARAIEAWAASHPLPAEGDQI
jgi:uncharacterized protein YndB with AHSA1/START domain